MGDESPRKASIAYSTSVIRYGEGPTRFVFAADPLFVLRDVFAEKMPFKNFFTSEVVVGDLGYTLRMERRDYAQDLVPQPPFV